MDISYYALTNLDKEIYNKHVIGPTICHICKKDIDLNTAYKLPMDGLLHIKCGECFIKVFKGEIYE